MVEGGACPASRPSSSLKMESTTAPAGSDHTVTEICQNIFPLQGALPTGNLFCTILSPSPSVTFEGGQSLHASVSSVLTGL